MALKALGEGQGFVKAGFLGFQGSGKTYTAILLAVAVREHFKLKGPIAMADTENSAEYVAPLVASLTGLKLLGEKTRDFDSLVSMANDCVQEGVSVYVADSMTHFWRSLCSAYLAGVNKHRSEGKYPKPPRSRLEFQDWGPLKEQWAKWTDLYLNSPLHIIIAGRAGYEYDMSKDEDTGRSELTKTGIKMKTEGEFGFEPSLLVQMEIEQQPDKKDPGRFIQVRTARVLKERFGVIDGMEFLFTRKDSRREELEAVMTAFGPHLKLLTPGAHSTVTTGMNPLPVSEEGNIEWNREKTARTILCEEIQGVIVSQIPGQSAEEKKKKADLLQQVFGTRSWTAVENMRADHLRQRLTALKGALGVEEKSAIMPDPKPPEEDDGDLGPQKAPPTDPAALAAGIRLLCKAHKIKESILLGYLAEVKAVKVFLEKFEDVPPEVLTMVSDNWEKISKEIKDATAPTV